MARKAVIARVSLGTFSETEARRIAAALGEYLLVPLTVENLAVDSGPTVWWHVYAPNAHVAKANTWLAGYRYAMASTGSR